MINYYWLWSERPVLSELSLSHTMSLKLQETRKDQVGGNSWGLQGGREALTAAPYPVQSLCCSQCNFFPCIQLEFLPFPIPPIKYSHSIWGSTFTTFFLRLLDIGFLCLFNKAKSITGTQHTIPRDALAFSDLWQGQILHNLLFFLLSSSSSFPLPPLSFSPCIFGFWGFFRK